MIHHNGFDIDVFHTGDNSAWVFEVFWSGKLIGESDGRHSNKRECVEAAKFFADCIVASVKTSVGGGA